MKPQDGSNLYGTAGFRETFKGAPVGSGGVIVPIVLSLVPIRSVVDVGCGPAWWLAEFMARGVTDVLGIDGNWVDPSALQIPVDQFVASDLELSIRVGRRFDLAVCVEVAEHLPETRAAGLIHDLVDLSPCVLFSAAIPGQGGTHHINEQFLSYWAGHFARHHFAPVDLIRPQIWNNENVQYWYRQNIIIFAAAGHPILDLGPTTANDYIHPEYLRQMQSRNRPPTLGEQLSSFPRALRRSIRSRWHKAVHPRN